MKNTRLAIILSVVAILIISVIILIQIFVPANRTGVNANSPTGMKVQVDGDKITLTRDKSVYIFEVLKENILRVRFMPDGVPGGDTAVIGKTDWDKTTPKIAEETDLYTVTTLFYQVKIQKESGIFQVYDAQGKLLLDEKLDALGMKRVSFTHQAGEQFYGIGAYDAWEDSSAGILRNTGGEVVAGIQGDGGAPLAWTTDGYGILVDSDGGQFSIDDTAIAFDGVSQTDLEYFIILGGPKEILSSVSEISGRPPMFPKWAMGFTNSEWGIDEEELIKTVDTYREKNIPIDNYTLDFDWKAWGEDNYGEFRWNAGKFPDGPSGKLQEIMAEKGIKLTGIMKPRIHVKTVQGQYATDHGFWYTEKPQRGDYFSRKLAGDIDFSIPEARTWFFDHAKGAFDTGIIGWWNDEADDGFGNLEHLYMQQAMYEGQRGYVNQRVWSINRNFYLGAQRYAYGLWSGDILSGFNSMAIQRERMLSIVNLGEVKWGMDIGGFKEANPSPENYARWIEFGAFAPIFRVHAENNRQRQPWIYGEVAEKAAKDAIQLRYSLIPYIYSYEREAYETGIGIVRPLIYDYPEDPKVANDTDSWMFGDYLLVSPVVKEHQTEKKIYLPEGTWIDYFKGTVYEGGTELNYQVNSQTWDDIPLFIKEGAIIPTQDVMNYVGEKPVDKVYLDIFPSEDATGFSYYDDDGVSYDYEKGVYFKQNITAQRNDNGAEINITGMEGTYQPELDYYIIKIHGFSEGEVLINGENADLQGSYDALTQKDSECYAKGTDRCGNFIAVKVKAADEKKIQLVR